MSLLFAAVLLLIISLSSASSFDWENADDEWPVKQVQATKVETVTNVKARSLAVPCIIPSKKVYQCGEPIEAFFNYEYSSPRQYARRADRIAIYPCYVDTFRSAELWQWGCGAPPATPSSCALPRSRGNVSFDRKPIYNGGVQIWPVAPNKRSNGNVNRCFKVVILRSEISPYELYCQSAGFTITENSKAGCAIRASSPSGN